MTVTVDDLPPTIRVGPHDIRFTRLSKKDAKKAYAQFAEADLSIELMDGYAAGSVAVDSILHELVHTIFFAASLKKETNEERIACGLGTYLAQVIRDNPEFVKWLQATVNK